MKHLLAPADIRHELPAAVLSEQQLPLRLVSIDINNADKYANQLVEIYNGSAHTTLAEHDPKAAVRIASLFEQLTQGGAI